MKHPRFPALEQLAREECGSNLVEFSLVATLLFLLLIGIIDCSLAFYAHHFVSSAAEEATRYAAVRGADWSSPCSTSAPPNFTLSYDCTASASDIQNYVQSLAPPGIVASSITVNTTSSYVWPGTTPDCSSGPCTSCSTNSNSQGCFVRVQVNYPFSFTLPLLPQSSISLTAGSEKVIQY
ncbi:MAG TPA: TadE/TadG family type IV pilus assembly protein [Acidobacteriaceae bacterium]|jgi:Flp pilus assembly protein TadG|nr:TadE/TadG family type IV pilus assembly protein [Acidobacteriaceae bacterium]